MLNRVQAIRYKSRDLLPFDFHDLYRPVLDNSLSPDGKPIAKRSSTEYEATTHIDDGDKYERFMTEKQYEEVD